MARRHWAFFFPTKVIQTGQRGDPGGWKRTMKFGFHYSSNKGQGNIQSHMCPYGEGNKEHSIWEPTAMFAQESFPAVCIHTIPMAVITSAPTALQDTAYLVYPISFSQAARAACLLTGQPWAFPCMEAPGTRQGPEIILQAEQFLPDSETTAG